MAGDREKINKLAKLASILSRADKLDENQKNELLKTLDINSFPEVDDDSQNKLDRLEEEKQAKENQAMEAKWRDILLNLKSNLTKYWKQDVDASFGNTLSLALRHWIDYKDMNVAKKVIKHWLENGHQYQVWKYVYSYIWKKSWLIGIPWSAVLKIKKGDLRKYGILNDKNPEWFQPIDSDVLEIEGDEIIIRCDARKTKGRIWENKDDFIKRFDLMPIVDIT